MERVRNRNVDDSKVSEFLKDIMQKIADDGHEVLYVVKFGSHLYGTNSESSDEDLKGIFLPSKKSCLLGKMPKSYTFSTGDKCGKNTSEDIDIQLWSLQYWMELLRKGETNAIDLLYSHTYPDMIVYNDGYLERLFRNHQCLFDVKNCNSYCGYAFGQAKKYGVKGSRLGVVKRVFEITNMFKTTCPEEFHKFKLHHIIPDILRECQDDSYCFVKELKSSNGEVKPYLVLCGSKHDLSIDASEFLERVQRSYTKYGDRAKQAEKNEGIDWKALSHAVRSLRQTRELLTMGKISYPLACAYELKEIKFGKKTWKEVERLIVDGLAEIDSMRENLVPEHKYDQTFVENFIVYRY